MKFLTCLLTAASLWSCSDADSDDAALLSEPESLITDSRTVDEILKIASDAYSMVAPDSRNAVNLSRSSIVSVRSSMYTTRAGDEPLIYAVNYGEGRGFALVSSSKKVTPLIGVSENGDYDPLTAQDNENFQFFLDAANDYAEYKASAQSISISDTGKIDLKPWNTFVYDTLIFKTPTKPKITVNWGEFWPENIYCPNGDAGCGPVALAQALSYYKLPTLLGLNFGGRPSPQIALNWDEICKHKVSESNPYLTSDKNCDATSEAHKAIGCLVRQIGLLSKTQYAENFNSGTSPTDLYAAAQQLLPSATYSTTSPNYLFMDLAQYGWQIGVVSGYSNSTPPQGHTWIADATYRITATVTCKEITGIKPWDYEVKWTKDIQDDRYIHYNWGWRGSYNGYFLANVFNPEGETIEPETPRITSLKSRSSNTDLSSNMFIFLIKK